MRTDLIAAYRAALRAVDAEEVTYRALQPPIDAPFTILALGKASPAMARGAARALGAVEGLAISDHVEEVPEGIRLIIGDHPLPDEASLGAGEALLAAAAQATGSLLVLVSGGGSALAEVPAGRLGLSDLARAQDLLMRAGAGIGELNQVRRHLSRLKNGGLLRAARVPTVTLLLSDVIDGPASDIASGPTLPDRSEPGDALAVITRYGLTSALPRVIEHLRDSPPPPPPDLPHRHQVIADGSIAAQAAVDHLRASGHTAEIITVTLRGEAAGAARGLIAEIRPGVVGVATGETTVTVTGEGKGGRNQHAALAAAIDIDGSDAMFAALGSDGRDGPTDAAGAITDGGTTGRIRRAGLDPEEHLQECDSYPALDAAGDLVRTGPTGTNVGDLWMAWRAPQSMRSMTAPSEASRSTKAS